MNKQFLEILKAKIATSSVGPSTARGMGPKGTVQAARNSLKEINLRSFNVKSRKSFEFALDEATNKVKTGLPKGSNHWGSSRKFLNIFLRGTMYNRFLCEEYKLYKVEPWLEVPLDSHVAKGLALEEGSEVVIPKWKTVIGLTPDVSATYQEFAEKIAIRKDTYRVHLDLLYWRGPHTIKK